MRPGDNLLIEEIESKLLYFNQNVKETPGIQLAANRRCFSRQILDSTRRVRYVTVISDRDISQSIVNPSSSSFNPLMAAVWYRDNGNVDEAFWLVFLAIHFGKSKRTGWNLVRNVYGQLNGTDIWTWERVTEDPSDFLQWVSNNADTLADTGNFGNHRKYESIGMLGEVVSSYINWVGPDSSHKLKIESIDLETDGSPSLHFDTLYRSMSPVFRFGRTAKFDYLCMIGKLGLADIVPGYTYMSGSTGPIEGARLLFGNNNLAPRELEFHLAELNVHLELYFGMQVLEDALCNWQKSPSIYKYFGG